MKRINLIVGAVAFAIAGASFANDQWYLGATAGHYDLDSDRAIVDDHKAATLGVQSVSILLTMSPLSWAMAPMQATMILMLLR